MFRFRCVSCGEWHEGMPSYGAEAPMHYDRVAPAERERRCSLGSDDCVIDEKFFFVRGCLDIPVHGQEEPFSWGVWVSLSRQSFEEYIRHFDSPKRSHIGPFFGWLSSEIAIYPDTVNLKARVHLRDDGIRPYIQLHASDHPLALEQREGISPHRVAEIFAFLHHSGS